VLDAVEGAVERAARYGAAEEIFEALADLERGGALPGVAAEDGEEDHLLELTEEDGGGHGGGGGAR
jgi:hypothetical protein